MKKFLAILLLGFSSVYAQTTTATTSAEVTTPNLITSGTTHTWTGVTTGTIPSGCATAGPCPGGPFPIYDPSTNTVSFSYNASAYVGQAIAVNQALANVGAGVKINGYNYSYEIRNMNGDDRQSGIDTITIAQVLRGANNSSLLSSNQYYNTKFDWQTISGSKTATTPIDIANATYLQFGMTGGDNGYWGGYFGPQVRNVNMSLRYTVDPCAANPAYSPTCANYNTVNFSNNLVPNPSAYAVYGSSIDQSYAINQALALSGSNVMIHGFQWGYTANANGPYCTSWDIFGCWGQTITPSVTTNVSITDSNNNNLYSVNRTYTNSYNTTSYQYLFPSSRNLATLGRFNFTASTYDAGYIGGVWSKAVYTPDPCADPLSSPTCPGYQQAYFNQQCTANPLYNSACPGYAAAMFTQQCNANQLSDPRCPGYAAAYLNQQCSINPLYSTTCSGYQTATDECSINPLSHSYCTNYQTASTQCSINPLYGSFCPGYANADSECTANPLSHTYCPAYSSASTSCSTNPLSFAFCPGYTTAQQTCTTNPLSNSLCYGYNAASTECSTNPLSHSYCPNYQTASQQCSANTLYANYCPGYQFAYACQQDGLYSKQCPNYAEAYAKKMLLEQQGLASTVATAGTVAQVAAVAAADPANATESTTSSAVSSNPVVASTVTTKSTSTTSETNPAAPVKLVAPAPAPAQQVAQAEPKKDNGPGPKEEKKEEGNKPNASGPSGGPGGDNKPSDQPKSNREALQERRREAAQKEAVAKGKDLANEMGKAADMESQKAVQNVVIQAMGFTPGFDTYNKAMLPDANRFYKPYQVYGGQVNVDNKNVSRRLMGGSDRTHQDMVDSQYNRGN